MWNCRTISDSFSLREQYRVAHETFTLKTVMCRLPHVPTLPRPNEPSASHAPLMPLSTRSPDSTPWHRSLRSARLLNWQGRLKAEQGSLPESATLGMCFGATELHSPPLKLVEQRVLPLSGPR